MISILRHLWCWWCCKGPWFHSTDSCFPELFYHFCMTDSAFSMWSIHTDWLLCRHCVGELGLSANCPQLQLCPLALPWKVLSFLWGPGGLQDAGGQCSMKADPVSCTCVCSGAAVLWRKLFSYLIPKFLAWCLLWSPCYCFVSCQAPFYYAFTTNRCTWIFLEASTTTAVIAGCNRFSGLYRLVMPTLYQRKEASPEVVWGVFL